MHFIRNFFLLPALMTAVVFAAPSPAKAESAAVEHNFALLISKPRHVGGALKMLEKMRKDKTRIQYKKARIVLYGDAIHTAKKGSEIAGHIEEAKHNGVTVAVCQQALKRLKVPETALLSSVEVVENAYYEMLRLKTSGYISLDL